MAQAIFQSNPEPAPEPPRPTPELLITQGMIEAMVVTMGAKKGERFLRTWAANVAKEEALANVLPIRRGQYDPEVRTARQQATVWFARALPRFLGRL